MFNRILCKTYRLNFQSTTLIENDIKTLMLTHFRKSTLLQPDFPVSLFLFAEIKKVFVITEVIYSLK